MRKAGGFAVVTLAVAWLWLFAGVHTAPIDRVQSIAPAATSSAPLARPLDLEPEPMPARLEAGPRGPRVPLEDWLAPPEGR